MAGRPVSLHGGQSGLLYGMITFAVLSVASLGLFIFQLTKNKAAENRARAAEDRLRRYGSPPSYYDRYYEDEATSRRSTVFAVMSDDLRKQAGLVTGVPEDVGASVLAKAGRVMSAVARDHRGTINESDTLLSAMTTMSELYAKEKKAAQAMAIVVEDLQAKVGSLTEQLKATRDEFEAQVAGLSERLKLSEEEKTDAVEQKDRQLREMQATLDTTEAQLQKIKREGNSAVRDKDIEIGRLQTMIAKLQEQVQALKPGSFDPSAILTSADGRIMRAIPGSGVVYVNLGAADRIRPGMGFEVYSQTRTSPSSLRGKASLEVVTVMAETSECRVTRRVPGRPIMEGDIVVNIAFERSRKPKFVVSGDFDLDYDGIIDFNGVEQVTSIIRQWGGQVVEELDESVDFVVIGLPPGGPTFDADERVSDIVRDQAVQKELERSRFRALVDRAQKMFIPVITQNRFLFLTGYAGDATATAR